MIDLNRNRAGIRGARVLKVSSWRGAGALCLIAGCLSLATPAFAQDEAARANARAAAQEGAKAFDESNWTGAIDMFERAESQFHSPVHLWFIARSAKEAGQLVRARESCLKVRREGIADDASEGVVASRDGCEEILTELEGRIPTLTLNVSGGEKGAKFIITRDGEAVPSALAGIPAPVDPGAHTFSAMADGYSAKEQTITLEEGQKESVTLELQVDPDARITEPEPAPAGATSAGPEDKGLYFGMPRWPAYTAWGLGLGGVAVGVVFGLDAQDKASQADELCGAGGRADCALDSGSGDASTVTQLNDDAGTSQMLSIIGYGAGGALIATGFVLWVLDVGAPKAEVAGVTMEPVVGLGHLGLSGSF